MSSRPLPYMMQNADQYAGLNMQQTPCLLSYNRSFTIPILSKLRASNRNPDTSGASFAKIGKCCDPIANDLALAPLAPLPLMT